MGFTNFLTAKEMLFSCWWMMITSFNIDCVMLISKKVQRIKKSVYSDRVKKPL